MVKMSLSLHFQDSLAKYVVLVGHHSLKRQHQTTVCVVVCCCLLLYDSGRDGIPLSLSFSLLRVTVTRRAWAATKPLAPRTLDCWDHLPLPLPNDATTLVGAFYFYYQRCMTATSYGLWSYYVHQMICQSTHCAR